MTALEWNTEVNKRYESGVSQGVLFPEDGPGVAWNGLISVDEGFVGGEMTSYYFDGIKYLDVMSSKIFQANIRAFSAPEEFEPCVGEISPRPGFILTGQQKTSFGLCYKTLLGDGLGYKLHLVYNASATRVKRDHASLAKTPTPAIMEWRIDTVPVLSEEFRFSAHFVFDSTILLSSMSLVEDLVYGTDVSEPSLPTPAALISLLE